MPTIQGLTLKRLRYAGVMSLLFLITYLYFLLMSG